MTKDPATTKQSEVPAFFLVVDGKEYGPFPANAEEETRKLYRHRGISARYVTAKESQLIATHGKPKPVKHEPTLF